MSLQTNFSLKKLNSFGIEASAHAFASFSNTHQLLQGLEEGKQWILKKPAFILGGGSNVLFTTNYEGLVLKNEIKGIEKTGEDDDHVGLRVGAGENWHQFVLYCINEGLGGVENLSLIPGCVGASPMQNIGAYGVEIKDVFEQLEAVHLNEKHTQIFNNTDCAFGYRESVFKRQYKNQFAITHVTFRLNKKPIFNTSYGAIEQQLEKMGVQQLSLKNISDAVISIRQSKLPDPAVTGNAGSFFKNPTVGADIYQALKVKNENMPAYLLPASEKKADEISEWPHYKIPAGWLIEQCGFKGYRNGDAGVHPLQALVLVNYGNASGQNIYDLSTTIIASVNERFGIELEREVNVVSGEFRET